MRMAGKIGQPCCGSRCCGISSKNKEYVRMIKRRERQKWRKELYKD